MSIHATLSEIGLRGYRDDYFDVWSQVVIEEVKRTKRNGVFVIEIKPVEVTVGDEFSAKENPYPEPTKHFRTHLAVAWRGVCARLDQDDWAWHFFRAGDDVVRLKHQKVMRKCVFCSGPYGQYEYLQHCQEAHGQLFVYFGKAMGLYHEVECPEHPGEILDDNDQYGGWGEKDRIGYRLLCNVGQHWVDGDGDALMGDVVIH